MLVKCLICGKSIDLHVIKKYSEIYPAVDSISCFKKLLTLSGLNNIEIIIKTLHSKGVATQILKDEKREFKSKIEKRVAEFFQENDIKYVYEKYVFLGRRLKTYDYQPLQSRYYIPDFFLPEYGVFIEVKQEEAITNKPLEFSKVAPLFVIDRNVLNILTKKEKK